jgi:hypothetical protein
MNSGAADHCRSVEVSFIGKHTCDPAIFYGDSLGLSFKEDITAACFYYISLFFGQFLGGNPDRSFDDFSKEALIKLLKAYRIIYVGYMGMSNGVYRQKMSVEEAYKSETGVYRRTRQKFSLPMVTQAMNIQ